MPGPTAPEHVDAHARRTEEVLAVVSEIIVGVVGETYVDLVEIRMETSFESDLDIESIEFVAIGEELTARYGEQVDFTAWIAGMEFDEIIDLTVGQLVEFIVSADG